MSVLKRRSFTDVVNYGHVYAAAMKAAQTSINAGGDPDEVLEDLAMVMAGVAVGCGLTMASAKSVLDRLTRVEAEATTYLDGAAEA